MRTHARAAAGLATLLAALTGAAAAPAAPAQRTHGPDAATAAAPIAGVARASDWCANADQGANQFDNGPYRYRAVYVHPADRPSRLANVGGELEAAAFGASGLIERLYGRAVRFDVGTPCGRGRLDIASVRLPLTYDQLAAIAAAGGSATFDAVAEGLRAGGFAMPAGDAPVEQLAPLTENFLVWLDAPAPARSCGQGTALLDSTRTEANLNNLGGKLALIFRRGDEFCGPDTIRHEIGHNLGALQLDAPNTTDGVHCNDAFEDTMCGADAPQVADGAFNGLFFDYGNDDYWDPPHGQPLAWWTVNLSRFLCPTSDCNRPDPPAGADRAPAAATRAKADPRTTRSAPRRPRLSRRLSRGDRYVRIRLRARGTGTARLVVNCKRRLHPGRAHPRRIVRRRVALPATVRLRTACRSPRARLTAWRPARG
jgi:hypothetical protein